MYRFISNFAKFIFPRTIRSSLQGQIVKFQLLLARLVFMRKPKEGAQYLEMGELEELQAVYRRSTEKEYSYDTDSLLGRGKERAEALEDMIARHAPGARTIVELGCGDGMTLWALARDDRILTGMDHSDDRFDRRARDKGVNFVKESVSRIDEPDQSVDLIFSFNAFEHFSDPVSVYDEISRTLRPGGIFYTNFGPLYNSPWGLHGYDVVGVPFCQHLFCQKTLDAYCDAHHLPHISFDYVNKWSHQSFERLFQSKSQLMKNIIYKTSRSTHGIDLVIKHPQCFRNKFASLDELLNSSIELLQKKQ